MLFQPDTFNFRKFLYSSGVSVLVLALVASGIFVWRSSHRPLPQKSAADVQVRQVSGQMLPVNIPKNLPAEKDAPILHNYEYLAPDGKVQSVREFVSKESVEQNTKVYKQYLSKEHWQDIEHISQVKPGVVLLTGRKVDITIKISITSLAPVLEGSRVEVMVLGFPTSTTPQ